MPESTILQIVRICVMFQSALFPICTTHSSLCLACAAEHHRAYLSATQGKAKPNLSTPLSCLLSIHRKPCPHIYCMANPYHAINIVVAPGLWLRGSSAHPPPRRAETPQHTTQQILRLGEASPGQKSRVTRTPLIYLA